MVCVHGSAPVEVGGNHPPVVRLVQKALYLLSLSLAPELCLYSYFKMICLVGIGIFVF